MAFPVTLTDPDGKYVAIAGFAPGTTPATSQNQTLLITAIGTPADAAWNGTSPNATVIALLKAIAQNTSTT